MRPVLIILLVAAAVGLATAGPLVVLRPGTFWVEGEDGSYAQVTLTRTVLMAAEAVTRAEFRTFVSETDHPALPDTALAPWWTGLSSIRGGDWPAAEVSFLDALHFANWLSRRDGLEPAYDLGPEGPVWNLEAGGWRLPTEAEWVYGAGCIDGCAAYEGEIAVGPVGRAPLNDLGLRGMLDDALEWCWDGYVATLPDSVVDPVGDDPAGRRVIRGLGLVAREWAGEDYRGPQVGFRLVRWAAGEAGVSAMLDRQERVMWQRRHTWAVAAVADSLQLVDWNRRDPVRRVGGAIGTIGALVALFGWSLISPDEPGDQRLDAGRDLILVGGGVLLVGGVVYVAAGSDMPRGVALDEARRIVGPPPDRRGAVMGVSLRF